LRLWFASFAYVMTAALGRIGLAGTRLAQASCSIIRLKLLKICALVAVSVRRVVFAMASGFPWRTEFAHAHVALQRATAWAGTNQTAHRSYPPSQHHPTDGAGAA